MVFAAAFGADLVCQYLLHEQSDPHVDRDKLADGNSVGVSTRPEGTTEQINGNATNSNNASIYVHE